MFNSGCVVLVDKLVDGKTYILKSDNEHVTLISSTSDPCWVIVRSQSGKKLRVDRAELMDIESGPTGSSNQLG